MPKFLHTADLHLNALRRFSKYYLDRIQHCLQSVTTLAEEHGVDFILVAGDIYDRRDITHAERMLLSEWLLNTEIPVVLISGNHDKRSAEIGDTCLSYLSVLTPNLTRHLVHDGMPTLVERFGCSLVLLPYQGWMDQELFLILQSLLDRCDPSLPSVVVLHEAVQGCKNDVGRTITKDNQIRLDNSFPDVTYWALGDIHLRQQMGPRAWYSGSPHQTRFDEASDKGVLIVDTDHPEDAEFVPVPSIPLLILTEEPEVWPSSDEAFVQFRPDGSYPDSALPMNVELHPSALGVRASDERDSSIRMVDVFDGLDDALHRAGLKEDLFPLAWHLAVKLAHNAGVETELPERYKVDEDE
jgi:DNA repair exonuclease SbcCD nuclease subunit